MRGYAQDIGGAFGPYPSFTHQVVGIFCSTSFPEPELITETLRRGQEHDPQTVWVVRDNDRVALAALEELGLEYVPVPLNPWWKVERPVAGPVPQGKRRMPPHVFYDGRRQVRESEICLNCSLVLVFAKPDPGSMADLVNAQYAKNIKVITRGKKKPRHRKGRKPVGV